MGERAREERAGAVQAAPAPESTLPAVGPEQASVPRGLLPLLSVIIFVVMMDGRVIGTILPQIASDLSISVAAAGIVITAYMLPYGLCQLAYGPLADRIGAMRIISAVSIAFVLAVVAGAFAPNLGLLVAVRLAAGGLAAAFFPLALATVGNLVPYAQRQGAIATLLAAVAAGQVMSAGIGGLLAQVLSWRAIYILDAVLVALLIVPLWRYRDATPPPVRPGRDPFAAHRMLLRNRRALVLYAAVMIEGLLYFGATGYLGALLRERDGLSYLVIGLVLALDGLATLLTSRVVLRARQVLGENRLMLTGGLLMGGGFLLALALPDWRALSVAVVAMGAGYTFFHSTLQTRATELNPAARGTAISLFAFALFMGGGLGTAALGLLLDRAGYDAMLLVCGLGLALLGALAPRLTAPRPGPAGG